MQRRPRRSPPTTTAPARYYHRTGPRDCGDDQSHRGWVAPRRPSASKGSLCARSWPPATATAGPDPARLFTGHSPVESKNVLTRFNAILGALFVVVVMAGPPQDALFGAVLAANTAIGVVQEIRARNGAS